MNKNTSIILIAVALIVGLVGGYLVGTASEKKTTDDIKKVVNLVFPAPSEEVFSLTGVVKEVRGNSLDVEVRNPSDYLPHADGTSPDMEIRTVSVTDVTKIISVDVTQYDANGNPLTTDIALSALTPGTGVAVRSDTNIRDAMSFTATQIETVKY